MTDRHQTNARSGTARGPSSWPGATYYRTRGPSSPFALALRGEPGNVDQFSRKCPKCTTWWVNRGAWRDETELAGEEIRELHTEQNVTRPDKTVASVPVTYIIRASIRQHSCGGQMFDEGTEINRVVGDQSLER